LNHIRLHFLREAGHSLPQPHILAKNDELLGPALGPLAKIDRSRRQAGHRHKGGQPEQGQRFHFAPLPLVIRSIR
jgi:hypothetical protein